MTMQPVQSRSVSVVDLWRVLTVVIILLIVPLAVAPPAATADSRCAVLGSRTTPPLASAHFEEPLVATCPTSPKEDRALVRALTTYPAPRAADDFGALTAFLAHYPHSGWRTALWGGTYAVELLRRVTLQNGAAVDLWSARDAVVLQALALVLPHHLPLSPCCPHRTGHGGLTHAVRQVLAALPQQRVVLKTDVRSSYASIDHALRRDRLAVHSADRQVLQVIGQYLRRCAERGGLFWAHRQGLALGSPLSPILGAFFLTEVDDALERLGLFALRYMDDILVLAPTRWKLHQAVKVLNQLFAALRLDKHPDKTFIGSSAKGCDFLGYHFGLEGLTVAARTLDHFVARVHQLYEQGPGEHGSARLGAYVRRWGQWVRAGLPQTLMDWSDQRRGELVTFGAETVLVRARPEHLLSGGTGPVVRAGWPQAGAVASRLAWRRGQGKPQDITRDRGPDQDRPQVA